MEQVFGRKPWVVCCPSQWTGRISPGGGRDPWSHYLSTGLREAASLFHYKVTDPPGDTHSRWGFPTSHTHCTFQVIWKIESNRKGRELTPGSRLGGRRGVGVAVCVFLCRAAPSGRLLALLQPERAAWSVADVLPMASASILLGCWGDGSRSVIPVAFSLLCRGGGQVRG